MQILPLAMTACNMYIYMYVFVCVCVYKLTGFFSFHILFLLNTRNIKNS